MIEDHLTLKLRYERFIKKVCETQLVVRLQSQSGFATSFSKDHEDEDDNPVPIICFWSEPELAQPCAKDHWQGYEVSGISLPDFMENWCVGMAKDELLIGINFDEQLTGFEVKPQDLLSDLITELRYLEADISFVRYKDLSALENRLR